MSECIFCRIVAGTVPSKTVYADDETVAFEDINPQAPVHILVIPRKHVSSLGEVTEGDQALLGRLMRTCVKIAQEKGIGASGYRIVTNAGRDGGQTVFHIHMHLLGGRPLSWPPG